MVGFRRLRPTRYKRIVYQSRRSWTGKIRKFLFSLWCPRSPWAVSDIRSLFSILLTKKLLYRHAFYLTDATSLIIFLTRYVYKRWSPDSFKKPLKKFVSHPLRNSQHFGHVRAIVITCCRWALDLIERIWIPVSVLKRYIIRKMWSAFPHNFQIVFQVLYLIYVFM